MPALVTGRVAEMVFSATLRAINDVLGKPEEPDNLAHAIEHLTFASTGRKRISKSGPRMLSHLNNPDNGPAACAGAS